MTGCQTPAPSLYPCSSAHLIDVLVGLDEVHESLRSGAEVAARRPGQTRGRSRTSGSTWGQGDQSVGTEGGLWPYLEGANSVGCWLTITTWVIYLVTV